MMRQERDVVADEIHSAAKPSLASLPAGTSCGGEEVYNKSLLCLLIYCKYSA
jgi:hypothetical protein